MDYLFFDIECANCFNGNGKICSFGYVIADERLRITEQRDIVVNPRQKFHLHSRNGACDIELAYPTETFRQAPDFPYFYEEISQMLTAPDRFVFGHSVNNDIGFLMSECRRYQLPYFDFNAYDTQILHRYFTKAPNDCALSKICDQYGIEVSADLHRSDYDAYLTLNVLKALAKEQNVAPDGLLELCPNAYYSAREGKIVNHFTTVSYTKRLLDLAKHFRPTDKSKLKPEVNGKIFCFSKSFESDCLKQAMYLVKQIRTQGGYYASKIGHSDYFLAYGEACARTQQLPELTREGCAPVVMDEEGMLQLLGVPREEYDQCPVMSYSALRGGRKRGRNQNALRSEQKQAEIDAAD